MSADPVRSPVFSKDIPLAGNDIAPVTVASPNELGPAPRKKLLAEAGSPSVGLEMYVPGSKPPARERLAKQRSATATKQVGHQRSSCSIARPTSFRRDGRPCGFRPDGFYGGTPDSDDLFLGITSGGSRNKPLGTTSTGGGQGPRTTPGATKTSTSNREAKLYRPLSGDLLRRQPRQHSINVPTFACGFRTR